MTRLRSSVFVLFLAFGLLGADWPQWLGPNRDSTSQEVIAPWHSPPRVVWRQPVGEGHSAPVVAHGRVFLHSKVQDKEEEEVSARDARTGDLIWKSTYARGAFSSIFGNGPRATPAVHTGHVYTFGVTGVLTCFEAATGKRIWQVDTLKKFQAPALFFGASCSPLIEGDRVLINVGAKGASVVAFDTFSGETAWKTLDDRASYSSPIRVDQVETSDDGGTRRVLRQIVFLTQQGLVSLTPREGRLRWRFPLVDVLSESSSTPLRAGDTLIASSITYGTVGLELAKKGDQPTAKQLWKNPELTCYFSSPVAVGEEHVYVVTGTKPPALNIQATLNCIEKKTGKALWQKPKVGKYHASLIRTGDGKLLLLEDSGNLALLDPNPNEYRELARSQVCGETWAHAALANGHLYVRDRKELICLEFAK
jgi:outer membrane protein assembly factor BamB